MGGMPIHALIFSLLQAKHIVIMLNQKRQHDGPRQMLLIHFFIVFYS
jgi:hypothetical protein